MRVNLKVSYQQRHRAKSLGARWDSTRQTWYVENVEDLSPFLQWMPEHLTKAHQPKEKLPAWWEK
jgi:uncharacterized protein DUF5710